MNHDSIIGQTQADILAFTVFTGTGTPTGPGGTYAVGDTFDGIVLTAGQREPAGYQVGDTFDGITLVAGATEVGSYQVGDIFDGITLTAGVTETADKYAVGDAFDGITLVAGRTEHLVIKRETLSMALRWCRCSRPKTCSPQGYL